MIKTTRNILVCIILFCALAPPSGPIQPNRPTPRDHYKTDNVKTKPKKGKKTRCKEFAQRCAVKLIVDLLAPKSD